MENTQNYQPGDVVDGHVLGDDGNWRPVPAPTVKRKNTAVVAMVAVLGLACAGALGFAAYSMSENAETTASEQPAESAETPSVEQPDVSSEAPSVEVDYDLVAQTTWGYLSPDAQDMTCEAWVNDPNFEDDFYAGMATTAPEGVDYAATYEAFEDLLYTEC